MQPYDSSIPISSFTLPSAETIPTDLERLIEAAKNQDTRELDQLLLSIMCSGPQSMLEACDQLWSQLRDLEPTVKECQEIFLSILSILFGGESCDSIDDYFVLIFYRVNDFKLSEEDKKQLFLWALKRCFSLEAKGLADAYSAMSSFKKANDFAFIQECTKLNPVATAGAIEAFGISSEQKRQEIFMSCLKGVYDLSSQKTMIKQLSRFHLSKEFIEGTLLGELQRLKIPKAFYVGYLPEVEQINLFTSLQDSPSKALEILTNLSLSNHDAMRLLIEDFHARYPEQMIQALEEGLFNPAEEVKIEQHLSRWLLKNPTPSAIARYFGFSGIASKLAPAAFETCRLLMQENPVLWLENFKSIKSLKAEALLDLLLEALKRSSDVVWKQFAPLGLGQMFKEKFPAALFQLPPPDFLKEEASVLGIENPELFLTHFFEFLASDEKVTVAKILSVKEEFPQTRQTSMIALIVASYLFPDEVCREWASFSSALDESAKLKIMTILSTACPLYLLNHFESFEPLDSKQSLLMGSLYLQFDYEKLPEAFAKLQLTDREKASLVIELLSKFRTEKSRRYSRQGYSPVKLLENLRLSPACLQVVVESEIRQSGFQNFELMRFFQERFPAGAIADLLNSLGKEDDPDFFKFALSRKIVHKNIEVWQQQPDQFRRFFRKVLDLNSPYFYKLGEVVGQSNQELKDIYLDEACNRFLQSDVQEIVKFINRTEDLDLDIGAQLLLRFWRNPALAHETKVQVVLTLAKAFPRTFNALIGNASISSEEGYAIGEVLVELPTRLICQFLEKLVGSPEARKPLLKKAAAIQGLEIAEGIQRLDYKDAEFLLELAKIAVKNNPKVKDCLAGFGPKAQKYFDQLQVNQLLEALHKTHEGALEQILFEASPRAIAKAAKIASLELKSSEELASASQRRLICKMFERAAKKYQRIGQPMKAFLMRFETSKLPLIGSGSALENFEQKLKSPLRIQSQNGPLNFGVVWKNMDSQDLKGGFFRVREVVVDQIPERRVDCKVSYAKADEIRQFFGQLDGNPKLLEAMEKSYGRKVTLENAQDFHYYCANAGNYDTQAEPKVAAGKVIRLSIEGVGSLQIGADLTWGSVSNLLRVVLPSDGSVENLHQLLSTIGMANLLTESGPADLQRLKINALIRFQYPAVAAKRDLEHEYFEMPIDQLLSTIEQEEHIPGFAAAIKKLLPRLKVRELATGEPQFILEGLSRELERLGARGLVCGMGSNKNFSAAAQNLASIISGGFLSSQSRFEAGLIVSGASSEADLQVNAADNVFFRLITEKATQGSQHKLSNRQNLGGCIQVLLKTKLLDRLGYALPADSYGCRNRQSFAKHFESYRTRGNIYEFVSSNQRDWKFTNEVMLKHSVSQDSIAAICYQDPRLTLIKEIEAKDPDFFAACDTTPKKMACLAANHDAIKRLLGGDEYKTFSLESHWLVDPRQVIEEALQQAGCDLGGITFVEVSTIDALPLELCHSVKKREKRLEKKARQSAGLFAIDKLSSEQRAHKSHRYIERIKNALQIKNSQELCELVPREMRIKIEALQKECALHLADIAFSGRNSLNQQLLTAEWNHLLRDPETIIALYAIAELQERGHSSPLCELNQFTAYGSHRGTPSFISQCLEEGLKFHHPVLLEKLPLNTNANYIGKEEYLENYLNASQIDQTFLPVIKAIEQAFAQLTHEEPSSVAGEESLFNQPYSPEKWQNEYQLLLKSVMEKIAQQDELDLLKLKASQNTPEDLRGQALAGLQFLMDKEQITSSSLSPEQLSAKVASSTYLIHPFVSHLFYDRLHLAAILKDQAGKSVIPTAQGNLSLRDLVLKIMESFSSGVTLENAIAAEQFYLRLVMLDNQLSLSRT